LNLAFEEKRRVALEKARNRGVPTMTDPINLVQGGKGFLVYFPIFVKGQFEGFILAVFRIQEWLDYVFLDRLGHFKTSVFIDSSFVFKQKGWDAIPSTQFEGIANVEIMGHNFTVYCRPTEDFFKYNNTYINEAIAGAGFLLTLLISFVVHLFQKATIETWRTHLAKQNLETTVQALKKTRNELHDASSRLDFATKAGNIGVWTWDVVSNKISWNSVMYELYDIPVDVHPTYETWKNALHPEDAKRAKKLLKDAVKGKVEFNTEIRIILGCGAIRYIKTAARIERGSTGKPIRMTGVTLDISEQKKTEEQFLYMANHDVLTELPTLRLAKDRTLMAINNAQRNKTSIAIMFIDLDGFKSVNDNYGHEAGDALLQEIAKRFLSCVRETDTVARIGGDEFLITLSEISSQENLKMIADELVEITSQTVVFKSNRLNVGASIGISLYPDNGENIESLIKQADEAMYNIKKTGKNGFAFALSE